MRAASPGSAYGDPVDLYTGSFTSLTTLFSGPTLTTNTDKTTWLNILPGSISYQDNCNYQGVNVGVSGWVSSSFRLGIWFNNENECYSCDSGVGVGGGGISWFWNWYSLASSEAWYECCGTIGAWGTVATYANVFIKQCATGQVPISTAPFCMAIPTAAPSSAPTAVPSGTFPDSAVCVFDA